MNNGGAGKRVLIAEDSPTQAAMLRAILEDAHYTVGVARDGREAFAMFSREAFDIVLSDIVMPGEDGFELCRHIKSHDRGARVPVILLTTVRDPMDIARGLDAGADDFICKPYDPAELVAKVGFALTPSAGMDWADIDGTDNRARMIRLLISAFEATARRGAQLEATNAALAAAKALVEGAAARLRREQGNILEAAGDGIVGLDRDGLITFINSSALETLGWSAGMVEGRGSLETFMHSRPDGSPSPREESPVFAVLAGRRPYHRAEAVFQRRDGAAVPVEHTCTPMKNDAGEVVGAVLAFRDITERKRKAAEHEKLEEELRQSHKMEAVGRLAGGVAHDFNNVLTVILGFSELILAETVVDEVTRGRIGQIRTAAGHAAALTRQLLAFSRRQVLHLSPISLGDTVAGMDQILRQLAGAKVEVVLTVDPAAGRVMGDAGQIGQVLVNLVVNSADAMPGGGRITIGIADGDPARDPDAPAALHPGPHVRLSVTDTGTGMSAGTRARIFEPFFTTKAVGAGTGLGLATVFGIVQQCGGILAVRSAPDQGTTISMYLPRLGGAAPAEAMPALDAAETDGWKPVAAVNGVGATANGAVTAVPADHRGILLVEAKADIRELLREVLTSGGYRVRVAASSAEALASARTPVGGPDLLLTDLEMPGRSGSELAAELHVTLPKLRVLLMSGTLTTAGNGNRSMLDGYAFLQKPFTPAKLLETVKEVLHG